MPLPVAIVGAARVGGAIGGALFGKRERSSCRSISPGDVAEFRAGRKVPHVLWERADDVLAATGKTFGEFFGSKSLTHATSQADWFARFVGSPEVAKLAELHMNVFVPLCEQIEGGANGYTTDPGSGEGLAMYNAAREAFKDRLRSGQLGWTAAPIGTDGNQNPVGETLPPPQAPLTAGGLPLALGAIALLLFVARKG